MVIGSIDHMAGFIMLDEVVMECIRYAKEHDLSTYKPGRYDIHGDKVYVNIEEYSTQNIEHRSWEAHKTHIDIQMILSGKEQIDLNFMKNMQTTDYIEERDVLKVEGEKNVSVVLGANDFVVCYPDDAHKPGIAATEPERVKKAIFKIEVGQ